MPPPGRRPTAFEVSFGERLESTRLVVNPAESSGPNSLKRKSETRDIEDGAREPKRRPLPPVDYFHKDRQYEKETRDLHIVGEDPLTSDTDGADPQDKPVRVLTDFAFFDPSHGNELVSLASIEEDDGKDRQFEGAGAVLPFFVSEEDEGQEEEDDAPVAPKYVRLGAILRYTFDVTTDNDPVWIETTLAWYVLKVPSKQYVPYYEVFFGPRRIVQMVISTALKNSQREYNNFVKRFEQTVDMFGRTYKEEHLLEAVPELHASLEDLEDYDLRKVKPCPLIRQLLRKGPAPSKPKRRTGAPAPERAGPPIKRALQGDLDLAVLKPENQTPTHVTPLIAELARGLVREELVVIGPPPPPVDEVAVKNKAEDLHRRLKRLIIKAKNRPKRPKIEPVEHWERGSRYLRAVKINDVEYRAGDFILVPIGTIEGRLRPGGTPGFPENISDVKATSTVADYFWFARIIYGDEDRKSFHVQWLEHGSETLMEELAHPQELFYHEDWCDSLPFQTVVAKIVVHEQHKQPTPPPPNAEHFFVKFNYNRTLGTFTSIDPTVLESVKDWSPPNNCAICVIASQRREEEFPRLITEEENGDQGIAFRGERYHLLDYVLYRSEKGPANIGCIQDICLHKKRKDEIAGIVLHRVGRVRDLPDRVLPNNPTDLVLKRPLRDERHLYYTDEEIYIDDLELLIRPVYVVAPRSNLKPIKPDEVDFWVSVSPDHFYIQFKFAGPEVKNWNTRSIINWQNHYVCQHCMKPHLDRLTELASYMDIMEKNPLATVDLFGGVMAFSHGLAEGSGCLRVTDTVEKAPSAALTSRRNFEDVKVHNQCANVILRYSLKTKERHQTEVPKQIYDEKEAVPPPITKAKCLVAGFPCQSHSRLNMYRKADDVKSNLILNALSWVDHLRPDFCYFENVPGFLQFAFDASQAGIYRTEGGTDMGGLKFLVRVLVDLRYQVRFGLLQAAHYGSPQRRTRFFLIAATNGIPLPELPQPSHDFPETKGLSIKLTIDPARPIQPIRPSNGTAPHRVVSIDEAIGDLPVFDWAHPNPEKQKAEARAEALQRAQHIPAFPCKDQSSKARSGYSGENFHYRSEEPKSGYQAMARRKATKDIQHYTRTFVPGKVRRVLAIPLEPSADYRNIPINDQEWSIHHPDSSVARSNYRPELYGRLNSNEWFPTTVTNMEPTAKQSRVLHPYCKRMVTVRELARSQGFPDDFIFEARNHNVVTMHRQIGNAVPIPIGVALGRELRNALFKKWKKDTDEAQMVS